MIWYLFITVSAAWFTFGVIDVILLSYLAEPLCSKFDGRFKTYLHPWTSIAWSRKIARTGVYAGYVASPSIQPDLYLGDAHIGYPFKEQVSPRHYRMCRVHRLFIMYTTYVWFPVGLVYLGQKYLFEFVK